MDLLQQAIDGKIWEWVFSGVGVAFIGFAYVQLKKLAYLRNHAKLDNYSGAYEVYFYRVEELQQIILTRLLIEKRALGRNKITFNIFGEIYLGYLYFRGHNIFLVLKGDKHEADAFLVLNEPLGKFDVLVGIYVATSKSSCPVSGKIILKMTSRQKYEAMATSSVAKNNMPEDLLKLLEGRSKNQIVVQNNGIRFTNNSA
jgi:hypothetical protein